MKTIGGTLVVELRPRTDALLEGTRYRDDGCDVSPSSLTCPLEQCRYEVHGGLRALRNIPRDEEVVRLRATGVAPVDIAEQFAISKRSVFRILQERAT